MKIEKLPSGSYRAQVMIDHHKYSITRDTPADVRRAVDELRRGKTISPADMTVGKAVAAYIAEREPVLSPSTVAGYKEIAQSRFQSMMPRKCASINQRQWQTAISDEAKTASAKTVKNSWGLISAALKYTGAEVPQVKLPQVVQNEHKFLEPEQIPVFLSAIKGKLVEVPALLALHGLRKSELLALNWDKIDLDSGVITVSGAVVVNSDRDYVEKRTNKNSTSARLVPIMIPRLKEVLQAADKSRPVVLYKPTSILKAVNRACEDAGLPLVGIHGLRHSAVSLAYSLGMNEMACMRLFGYSDYQTMRKIYTHLAQKDLTFGTKSMISFYSAGNKQRIQSAIGFVKVRQRWRTKNHVKFRGKFRGKSGVQKAKKLSENRT